MLQGMLSTLTGSGKPQEKQRQTWNGSRKQKKHFSAVHDWAEVVVMQDDREAKRVVEPEIIR